MAEVGSEQERSTRLLWAFLLAALTAAFVYKAIDNRNVPAAIAELLSSDVEGEIGVKGGSGIIFTLADANTDTALTEKVAGQLRGRGFGGFDVVDSAPGAISVDVAGVEPIEVEHWENGNRARRFPRVHDNSREHRCHEANRG